MKKQIAALKVECKKLASEIRESKRKVYNPMGPCSSSAEFRYKHIVYCLLRGRTLEQIENKHRDPNDGTHAWVTRKVEELMKKLQKEAADEQALCADPIRPS